MQMCLLCFWSRWSLFFLINSVSYDRFIPNVCTSCIFMMNLFFMVSGSIWLIWLGSQGAYVSLIPYLMVHLPSQFVHHCTFHDIDQLNLPLISAHWLSNIFQIVNLWILYLTGPLQVIFFLGNACSKLVCCLKCLYRCKPNN